MDRQGKKTCSKDNRFKPTLLFVWCCKHGPKAVIQTDAKFNTETFLDFLKTIHCKFPKCYLFMDKASPHYKSRRVKDYLEENKDTLIPVYLPTASPEFMMVEEIWNIAKRELSWNLKYYSSFEDFKEKVSRYFHNEKFWSKYEEELFTEDSLGTYMKWYNMFHHLLKPNVFHVSCILAKPEMNFSAMSMFLSLDLLSQKCENLLVFRLNCNPEPKCNGTQP